MLLNWKVVTNKNTYQGGCEVEKITHIQCELKEEVIQKAIATVHLPIHDTDKIFMNGYQTWTTCMEYTKDSRIRGMHRVPKFLNDKFHFDRYGDYHFVEYPYRKGITHGFSWCYFRHEEEFTFFGSLDEKPGYTMFQYDANKGILTIERDCVGIHANGIYPIFDLYYQKGMEEEVFDGWFDALQITPLTTEKIYGYSSWYNRYQNISEQSIMEDLENCKLLFEPNDLFQVDDGWEPFVGDWLESDKTKFPNGMKWVADQIHESGYRAGLWLAPFVAEEKSSLFQNHRDWFLQRNGEPWCDGGNWSGFYSLDFDKKEVKEYLTKVFHQVIDEWGYDLVKLDFLYGIAPFGSSTETRAAKMARAMEFLRELCKDKLILGCGVPVMPAFGVVDYCRISCDVSLDWDDVWYMKCFHRERTSTKQAIGNILSRRELNNRAYGSDPDVFFLRDENTKLTTQEKDDLAILDALLGNVFLISDNPGNYTKEMKEKYKKYRALSKAKVLSVKDTTITYELDGKQESVTLFQGKKF